MERNPNLIYKISPNWENVLISKPTKPWTYIEISPDGENTVITVKEETEHALNSDNN